MQFEWLIVPAERFGSMVRPFAQRASNGRKLRTRFLAAAICCAICAPAGYATTFIAPVVITKDDLRKIRKERRAEAAICREVLRNRAQLDRFLTANRVDAAKLPRIASRFWDGGDGCREDRSLAIAIMNHVVGSEPLNSKGEAIGHLVTYLVMRGRAEDIVRSTELQRIMSLRGDYYSAYPKIQWTPEELRAFVVRDDVWAYLNRPDSKKSWQAKVAFFDVLSDPNSPRFDRDRSIALGENVNATPEQQTRAAELLLSAPGSREERDRAEALLTRAARYSEEPRLLLLDMVRPRLLSGDRKVRDSAVAQLSAWLDVQTPAGVAVRSVLTPLIARDLSSGDVAIEARAVTTLTNFVILGTRDAEAPLLGWVDRVLQKGGNPREGAAISVIRRLILAGNPLGRRSLEAEFDRHGGLAQAGQLSAEQGNLAHILSADDYPARALRAEEDGVVEASALIAPDGTVVAVIITRSAGPALDSAVSRLIPSRARGIKLTGHSGRYVEARLPPIQFRLKACGQDAPADPILPKALLVESSRCPAQPSVQQVAY